MHVLIADCETDGFLPTLTKVWTIQIGLPDEDEVVVYADQPGYPPLSEALERLKSADRVVFHGGTKFDIHAINKVYPGTLRPEQIYDTVVVARLLNPKERNNSLKDWGERLGCAKGEYEGDFKSFSEELVTYARQDVVVTRELYRLQLKKMAGWDWSFAVWMECLFAYCIALQEQNGFLLDLPAATALAAELRQELHEAREELQKIFPPIITERFHKRTGKPLKPHVEVFNPGSGQQIARRLIAKYGWKPKKFTDTGIPATDESVLSELPYPEAAALIRYLRVQKVLGQIEGKDGSNGWLQLLDYSTNRIHGAVNTIGTATGRCSHFKPNMGQVDKKEPRMRAVWVAGPGKKLVGVDAEALEFRMLAHYVAKRDGGITIERVLNGDKKLGTDIHSVNRDAVGMYDREEAKRLIYALMYGASDTKLGLIVIEDARKAGKTIKGKPAAIGKRARELLGKGTPGLDKLVEAVRDKAQRTKFIRGLDGRKIFIRSKHSAFNFLLQGAGAIVMKLALVIFHFERAPKLGWEHGVDFAYCANVHDEVQSEVRPEIAEAYGRELADCIREAGERLNVRCPLAGSFDIGNNWKETH